MLMILSSFVTHCRIVLGDFLDLNLSCIKDLRSIGQKSTFSEHGHVAYQIKWTHEMQQHASKYFARRPPSPTTLGDGVNRSKFSFYRTWSCCISNQMESRNAATW